MQLVRSPKPIAIGILQLRLLSLRRNRTALRSFDPVDYAREIRYTLARLLEHRGTP